MLPRLHWAYTTCELIPCRRQGHGSPIFSHTKGMHMVDESDSELMGEVDLLRERIAQLTRELETARAAVAQMMQERAATTQEVSP